MSSLALASLGAVRLADGDSALGAGFIAFVVVVVLSVACFFLFRSMTRHLRKVPPTFDPSPPAKPDDE